MPTTVTIECEYPSKMFYRINEVSRITAIKPYVLRYWETEFPQLSPSKDRGDQRRYKAVDIELVLQIKRLLYEDKFTIAGARRRLEREAKRPARIVTVERPPEAEATERSVRRLQRMLTDLRRDVKNLHNFI
jgi:DNA-binding transcriptional MerR regulator